MNQVWMARIPNTQYLTNFVGLLSKNQPCQALEDEL